MADNWDDEDKPTATYSDKWSDEDLDDVKDNWDDDDSDTEKPAATKEVAPASKKSTKQRIMEKQAQKEAEREAKRAELAKIAKEQTAEEKLAEKMRLQKLQEDSDLEYLKDFKSETSSRTGSPLPKTWDLSNQAGLVAFGKSVIDQVKATEGLEKSLYYATFLETFVKDLCSEVETDDLKKIIGVLNTQLNDKIKAAKPSKNKNKNKAKLNSKKEKKNLMDDADDYADDRYIDDLDDFI